MIGAVADGWYVYWGLRGVRRVLAPGERMPLEGLDIVGPGRTHGEAEAFVASREASPPERAGKRKTAAGE